MIEWMYFCVLYIEADWIGVLAGWKMEFEA